MASITTLTHDQILAITLRSLSVGAAIRRDRGGRKPATSEAHVAILFERWKRFAVARNVNATVAIHALIDADEPDADPAQRARLVKKHREAIRRYICASVKERMTPDEYLGFLAVNSPRVT